MEWILIAGIALTGIGILVGLYLPILAAQFVVPEKIQVCAIAGAMLVVIGTAMEMFQFGQPRMIQSRRLPIKKKECRGLGALLNLILLRCRSPSKCQPPQHAIGQLKCKDTMAIATRTARALLACHLAAFFWALAGCSQFGKPEEKPEPNIYPANYKKDLLAYLREKSDVLVNASATDISTRRSNNSAQKVGISFACTSTVGIGAKEICGLLRRADQSICRRNKRTVWCCRVPNFSRSFGGV